MLHALYISLYNLHVLESVARPAPYTERILQVPYFDHDAPENHPLLLMLAEAYVTFAVALSLVRLFRLAESYARRPLN